LARGQGLVEFTLVFPILLILLSGLIEFGFALNQYLDILDGAREAARFASDADPFLGANPSVDNPAFYKNASDLAEQTMSPLSLNPTVDDIVISAFSVTNGTVVRRFPNSACAPYSCIPNQSWARYGNQTTEFTNADINARLTTLAPSTGIVLVEVFFAYDQKFKLPWITAFVPDPILVHSYTLMPLVAAEPTPTP
jgi:Flp pilus assembly protein TadG